VDVPEELIFEDTGSVLLVKKKENGLKGTYVCYSP